MWCPKKSLCIGIGISAWTSSIVATSSVVHYKEPMLCGFGHYEALLKVRTAATEKGKEEMERRSIVARTPNALAVQC